MELSFRHQPAKPLELFRKSDVPNAESKFRLIPISNSRGMNGRKPNLSISAARKAIDGLNDEMNAVASKNMDFAAARRQVRSAFIDFQQHLDHLLFKMAPSGIRTEESYEINSRGLEIFCKKWLPAEGVPMKGILCFCHGYGDTCTFFFEGIAKRFAAAGYGVYALDYPGFGLSEGLHGYIPSFDVLANDVIEHYTKVKGSPEGSGLPHFLLGQSMGGAVALKVHLKQPRAWDGVILVAPMCKIAEDVTPPAAAIKLMTLLSKVLPEAKLVPQKDLAELAFRDPIKRKMAYYNVIAYSGRVRLKTAVELLKTTHEIEAQVEKVSSPLLVLHGAADKVTDPQISKFLHEKASSKDKTLKLYPEGYHSILEGEPDDRILKVIDDIISWLDSRCDLPKQ
ncbi:caffeoylshikimate esterase-like isoform X1 [Magnolia sinica]|uniref:caffeoylshikimate esterase-like isoform X1 n=1 Tax=Magnolia sinica TaxID=86752 RepID=UPI00265A0675|nr:caffeoylshikimate esterase-like isoform X1 [Magnolia sinica]